MLTQRTKTGQFKLIKIRLIAQKGDYVRGDYVLRKMGGRGCPGTFAWGIMSRGIMSYTHTQWRNEGGEVAAAPGAQHQRGAKSFSGTQYYDKND